MALELCGKPDIWFKISTKIHPKMLSPKNEEML
jgi:hypothetical protein